MYPLIYFVSLAVLLSSQMESISKEARLVLRKSARTNFLVCAAIRFYPVHLFPARLNELHWLSSANSEWLVAHARFFGC